MRKYLIEFLSRFEYGERDSKYLLSAYDKINETDAANKLFKEGIALYDAEMNCDFGEILKLADKAAQISEIYEYTSELLIFICMSKRLEERYAERGISENIFYNSMLDLKYKLWECKAVRGVTGAFVAWWFSGFFDLTRFALGRLQFELTDFKGEYCGEGFELKEGDRVINVHIPRSLTPLDEESCDKAFMQAQEFFAEEVGENCVFVCKSWLLYPENKKLISEEKNIYKFMSRFDIIRFGINKNGEDLWRLFDTDERNPERLPQDTSVRRAYVEHMKKGGKTGWGYGVFKLNRETNYITKAE